MAPVVLVVHMGVHRRACEKKVKKDLMKIPGVVEVCASLVTGHVAIVGMADAATLGELLAARLNKPVFFLADLGATPAPPVGGGYSVMPMPPPSPATSSPFPAGYQPYGYGAMPSPEAGYYTPFGGRPQGANGMPNDAPAATVQDEYHKGCCCSIQ